MAPFEALYGRKCRTPLNWVEAGERRYYGIDFVNEAEQQIRTIQQHLEAAQAPQKSYADKRRKPIEFSVGDHVYIKVSPMKGVQRFRVNFVMWGLIGFSKRKGMWHTKFNFQLRFELFSLSSTYHN